MKRHPNILLILAEKMRYDCIGSSQMRISNTPYLDWLAANGVWFEQAYTPQPNFTLAQQTLLQGKKMQAHSLLAPKIAERVSTLADNCWSLWLKQNNYLCSWFGAWQSEHCKPEDFGYQPYFIKEKINLDTITTNAAEWLKQYGQSGVPWHLFLSLADDIFEETEALDHKMLVEKQIKLPQMIPWPNFTDDLKGKPCAQHRLKRRKSKGKASWSDWSKVSARAVRQAVALDEAVGNLISQLNQIGLLENTLVIFTAASGSMCGSHQLLGNEYCCYEEIMRVPMFMHWPSIIPANLRCKQLVSSLLDLPATFIAYLNEEKATVSQGLDLSCFWERDRSDSAFCQREGVLSSQISFSQGLYSQRMFRDKRYKYVWNPTDIDELYDLQEDPYEMINCAKQEKEQVKRLKKLMLTEMEKNGDPLSTILQIELN